MAGGQAARLGQNSQPAADAAELSAVHVAKDRGRPYGDDKWASKIAGRLGIESSLKAIGRPKKAKAKEKGL